MIIDKHSYPTNKIDYLIEFRPAKPSKHFKTLKLAAIYKDSENPLKHHINEYKFWLKAFKNGAKIENQVLERKDLENFGIKVIECELKLIEKNDA